MGVCMSSRIGRVLFLSSSALLSLYFLGGTGAAQTPGNQPGPETPPAPQAQPTPGTLPTINVETTKKKPPKKQAVRQAPPSVRPTGETQQAIAERQTQAQVTTFNNARNNIYITVGANADTIGKEDIQRL